MNTLAAFEENVEAFRALLERQQAERSLREYPTLPPPVATVKWARKWIKVDVGTSGKYVVGPNGQILGIKAYGVPHYGHQYGTLDTIHEWDWSGSPAARLSVAAVAR